MLDPDGKWHDLTMKPQTESGATGSLVYGGTGENPTVTDIATHWREWTEVLDEAGVWNGLTMTTTPLKLTISCVGLGTVSDGTFTTDGMTATFTSENMTAITAHFVTQAVADDGVADGHGGVSRLLYLLNLLHLLSARWHVADVPGVQESKGCGATLHLEPISQSANQPICQNLPAGVWGGAPHIQ